MAIEWNVTCTLSGSIAIGNCRCAITRNVYNSFCLTVCWTELSRFCPHPERGRRCSHLWVGRNTWSPLAQRWLSPQRLRLSVLRTRPAQTVSQRGKVMLRWQLPFGLCYRILFLGFEFEFLLTNAHGGDLRFTAAGSRWLGPLWMLSLWP